MKTEYRSILIELLNDSNHPKERKMIQELMIQLMNLVKTDYRSLSEFANLIISGDFPFFSVECLELLL